MSVTKVKVQVGSKINKEQDASQVPKKSLDVPEFSESNVKSLADLCDSHYIFRQKRKASGKDIFPTSYGATKSTTSRQFPKQSEKPSSSAADKSKDQMSLGPRVEIIDGKIVLKESSLEIAGNDEIPINEDEYEEIEEGAFVSSRYSSFMNKRPSRQWGIEETRIFYHALRQCGTEFSLMQTFFPNRTRKELKLKFYREEKQHPELVKSALQTSLPLELSPFEILLGTAIDIPQLTDETQILPTALHIVSNSS